MPPRPYSLRFAFPRHYAVTLAVALLVLWGLTRIFGPTRPVLIGWLIAFLVASRVVAWIVARRRRFK